MPPSFYFDLPPTSMPCANCQHTVQVTAFAKTRQCAKCNLVTYCSRTCERTHYQKHKKECGKKGQSLASSSSKGEAGGSGSGSGNSNSGRIRPPPLAAPSTAALLPFPRQTKPFEALKKKEWLLLPSATQQYWQQHVYMLLIDAFRLHQDDGMTFASVAEIGSIYHNDNADSAVAFEFGFLPVAQQEQLLPTWMTRKTGRFHGHECVEFGMKNADLHMGGGEEGKAWGGLKTRVTEEDIVKWYGGESMVLQMRVFAWQVYGDDPSGTVKGWQARA
ncbi:hypothetical protein DV736_g500, partial [Chaetothyriales sp. CBS 134916]